MTMVARLLLAICELLFFFATAPLKAAEDERPNILFLLTDNQPWHAVGCAPNAIIYTPNMDRLAAGGVRFSKPT